MQPVPWLVPGAMPGGYGAEFTCGHHVQSRVGAPRGGQNSLTASASTPLSFPSCSAIPSRDPWPLAQDSQDDALRLTWDCAVTLPFYVCLQTKTGQSGQTAG